MQFLLISLFALVTILTGIGFLSIIYPKQSFRLNLVTFSLSFLFGSAIYTQLVFFLDMTGLPVNRINLWVLPSLFILATFLWKRTAIWQFFRTSRISIQLADLPPILLIIFFGVISIWRSFYYPPYSYDALMGIDLIAKYAVRDESISGSALFKTILPFTEGFTNQLFYAPYAMLMQVITRGIGIDFGQVWLGLLSCFFYLYFYAVARQHAVAAVAFFAVLVILFVPEFYAYSFILQTDYSNAIFFFTGVYYFYQYSNDKNPGALALSCAGMFFACWCRTETIFFIPFGSLWLLIAEYRKRKAIDWKILPAPVIFSFIPAISIFLWSILYKQLFLANTVNLGEKINPRTENLLGFIGKNYQELNTMVIMDEKFWNYTIPIFLIVLLLGLSIAAINKSIPHGIEFLFWILAVYLGFHLLLILFPDVAIPFTLRRGFFKMIPLFGFYLVLGELGRLVSGKPLTEKVS